MTRRLTVLVSILLAPILLVSAVPLSECDANIVQFEKPSVVEFGMPISTASEMPKHPQPSANTSASIMLSVAGNEPAIPKLALAVHYRPERLSISPNVSPYQLPLDLEEVVNLEEVESALPINDQQRQLLEENGFVVIPWQGDDIVEPYKTLKAQEVPIFVTSDTLLHLYHIQFNEILKRIEEEEFSDQLIGLSQAMMKRAAKDYESFAGSELKEAARRNIAYFAVALKLLQTDTEGIPAYVQDEVQKEIRNIENHEGFKPSAIFHYGEDYSQYVPRGHYTRSEELKRYFKAVMWYGRMAFLLKGGKYPDALVSEEDARIATIQASLISTELPNIGVGKATGLEVWNRIYAVTPFFVGVADDLTPYEYRDAIREIFGASFAVDQLADDEKLLDLKAELAQMRNPEIYGGSGVCLVFPPITKDKLYECLAKTKGMRFMGQRFVPDSYIFQNLVSPAVDMYVGDGEPFTIWQDHRWCWSHAQLLRV